MGVGDFNYLNKTKTERHAVEKQKMIRKSTIMRKVRLREIK